MKYDKKLSTFHRVELTSEEVEQIIVDHLRNNGILVPFRGLQRFNIEGVRDDVVVTWEEE